MGSTKYAIVFTIKNYQPMVLHCKDSKQFQRWKDWIYKNYDVEALLGLDFKVSNQDYQEILRKLEAFEIEWQVRHAPPEIPVGEEQPNV